MSFFRIFRSLSWVLPFLLFILGFYFLRSFVHKKESPTPNVIGKSTQEGLVTLSSCGLNLRLAREQESLNFTPGTILQQTPVQNQPICLNQHVFVVVSKRPKPGKVPNLLGRKYNDILPILRKFDTQPNIVWVEANYPKGFCITQLPMPGAPLMSNEEISLYVSSGGCSKFIVPNLKGNALEEARKMIEKFNVHVEVINQSSSKSSGNLEPLVADQTPMSGSIVDLDKKLYVQLLVK